MKSQLGKGRAGVYKSISLKALALCMLVIVLAIAIYSYRSEFGWFVWKNFHFEFAAMALNRNDPQLFFDIGNYYFGGGAYDVAKASYFYDVALAIDPSLQGVHYQRARVYFINGDFFNALENINTELRLYPDFKRSYYVRALIYGYSNKLSEAEADFKTFLKWKPESWAGHNDLAWIYFMEGDYKNSAATAREGLVSSPNNVWLLNSLGVALLNEGNLVEAKKALKEALASASAMTPADWGRSYPGNNPSVYGDGLDAMKASIQRNLDLIAAKK